MTARWTAWHTGAGAGMRKQIILVFLAILLGGSADAGAVTALSTDAPLQAAVKQTEAGNTPGAITALLALDGTPLAAGLQPQIDFLLGVLLARQGRHEEAVPRLEGVAASYPLLADYALFRLAETQRQLGRRELAADALRRLVGQHPQSLFLKQASRELARDNPGGRGHNTRRRSRHEVSRDLLLRGPGRSEVRLTLEETLLRSCSADSRQRTRSVGSGSSFRQNAAEPAGQGSPKKKSRAPTLHT